MHQIGKENQGASK